MAIAARMPTIRITTSSSMSVKPLSSDTRWRSRFSIESSLGSGLGRQPSVQPSKMTVRSPLGSHDQLRSRRLCHTPFIGVYLDLRSGFSARSSTVVDLRFSVASNLDALSAYVWRNTVSMALERGLLLLELLRVGARQTLTAAATPRADDLARVSAEIRDHLAAAVARHARPRLTRLLALGLLLGVLARARRGLARTARWGLLAIMCVAHGVARLAFRA